VSKSAAVEWVTIWALYTRSSDLSAWVFVGAPGAGARGRHAPSARRGACIWAPRGSVRSSAEGRVTRDRERYNDGRDPQHAGQYGEIDTGMGTAIDRVGKCYCEAVEFSVKGEVLFNG
jgi:hypothetical protein